MVHVAGSRQRSWYNWLHRADEAIIGLGRRELWVPDPTKPARVYSTFTSPALRLRGGWWRWPVHHVLARLKLPTFRGRILFMWPHWLTHYQIPIEPRAEDQHRLGFAEAADYLERLRGMGYIVPQYAIDALREEEAERPTSEGAAA
jgi:hypothetical protein